jgi:hypothetical protein
MSTPISPSTQLRRILTDKFSESELKALYFDLNVEYEALSGNNKSDKARELVSHFSRRNDLGTLIRVGSEIRPDINWPILTTKEIIKEIEHEKKYPRTQLDTLTRRTKILLLIALFVVNAFYIYKINYTPYLTPIDKPFRNDNADARDRRYKSDFIIESYVDHETDVATRRYIYNINIANTSDFQVDGLVIEVKYSAALPFQACLLDPPYTHIAPNLIKDDDYKELSPDDDINMSNILVYARYQFRLFAIKSNERLTIRCIADGYDVIRFNKRFGLLPNETIDSRCDKFDIINQERKFTLPIYFITANNLNSTDVNICSQNTK